MRGISRGGQPRRSIVQVCKFCETDKEYNGFSKCSDRKHFEFAGLQAHSKLHAATSHPCPPFRGRVRETFDKDSWNYNVSGMHLLICIFFRSVSHSSDVFITQVTLSSLCRLLTYAFIHTHSLTKVIPNSRSDVCLVRDRSQRGDLSEYNSSDIR